MDRSTALERLPDLAIVLGASDVVLESSDSWETVFGAPWKEAIGCRLPESALGAVFGEIESAWLESHLIWVRQGRDVEPLVISIEHPIVGPRVLEAHAHRNPADPLRITLVLRDMTSRFDRITLLAENERRFGIVAAATRDIVTETDYLTGRFTYVSSAVEAVLGYRPAELVGTKTLELHHPEDAAGFLSDLRLPEGGATFAVRPHRLRRRDGSWVWVEATGIRFEQADGGMRVIGVARDISARLEAERARVDLESQLQRSQRVESLGVLAGGIAHDFNNLLTPILGSASLPLEAGARGREDFRQRMKVIQASALRAKALTDQMLAYAGKAPVQRGAIELSKTVRGMVLLLESTASRAVTLHCELDDQLAWVDADENQIGQIVMNLVSNASEAAKPEGGRIEIRTCAIDATRKLLDTCVLGDQLQPGCYACLEVSDNGRGIDAETRERVLDPFFTTKFTGRGLGLAVVMGIVRGHGGALQVESEPGVGSRFRVLLPFSPEGASRSTPGSVPRAPTRFVPSGALLVVDDDAGARDLTSILLRRAGFEVLEADNGLQAVEIFRERAAELAGVVLDGTMPGMSGASVFAAIRAIEPDARVLLVSGYTCSHDAEALLERGLAGFLQKPFESEALMRAVENLLGSEAAHD